MMRVTADNMGKMIEKYVRNDATLMTDEHPIYKQITEMSGQKHQTVKHTDGEYVRKGDRNVHNNTVEGFFSLLKRGLNGTFHHVSRGHLARYCDEFAYRYERRKMDDGQRTQSLVQSAEGKRPVGAPPPRPVPPRRSA